MINIDIKHFPCHFPTTSDLIHTAFTYHFMLTSARSVSNLYLSPELQPLIDKLLPQLKQSQFELSTTPSTKGSLPISLSCLRQSPHVPTLTNHQTVRMLPPHFRSSPLFSCLITITVIAIIIVSITTETALKQFSNF